MFPFARATAALLFLCGSALLATPLNVLNAGFDADVLSEGAFTCNGTTGFTDWGAFGGGNCGTGLLNPNAAMQPGGAAPSGNNVAYTNGTIGYWQALSDTLIPGTYTFALQVGQRLDEPFGGYLLELRAGSTYLGSTLLNSVGGVTSPGAGAFATQSVTYTVNPGSPFIGQQLLVAFQGIAVQTNFDSVTVDGPNVPEPGTYALLGSALLTLAWIRRRR